MTQQEQDTQNKSLLTVNDTQEIEKVFSEAKDFRSIGEKITSPLDDLIAQTAQIIDKDPIMNVSDELQKMNGEVQIVYNDIINNDGSVMKVLKNIPFVWNLANIIDTKLDEAKFNLKTMEWKINMIFSGFDQAYTSINTSIDLQKSFLDWLDANIWSVIAYKDFIEEKISEFQTKISATTDENEKHKLTLFIKNVEYFQANLIVLIGNLDLAKKRLLIRLDSAHKLSLAMNASRPIFKTLLSTALIESSSQKSIDASIKAIDIMWSTIDKMSSDLTDKAIASSKKTEEISAKPVLSTTVFIDNVTKLKNHFDMIDQYREQIKIESEKEKVLFNDAKTKLETIKTISSKDHEELEKILTQ